MGITLRSATNGQGAIYFSDGTSGADEYRGIINYNHTNNFFSFFTNASERLRIDSSGDMTFKNSRTSDTAALSSIIFNNGGGEVARIRGETRNGNTNGMITFFTDISGTLSEKMRVNHDGAFCFGTDSGRTAEFSQPDGFSIRFDDKGQFQNSVSNTTGGYMNRKGSDGGILSFARQGTYVGQIGVNSSSIYLNFGGTNAADHQLDDYEEGTYVPTTNTGLTLQSSYDIFSYIKIGRHCTVRGLFYPNNNPSGGHTMTISLPFASYNYSQIAGAGGSGVMYRSINGADAGVCVYVNDNSSTATFYKNGSNGGAWSPVYNNDWGSAMEIYVDFTYFTV